MHLIINDSGDCIDLDTTEGQYKYVANALIQHGAHSQILAALANMHRTALLSEKLRTALSDAVSTYTGSDKLVTAERIEAWVAALGSDKA